MKEYICFETKLFLKDRRNFFLYLGTALYLAGLLFYIPYQNTSSIEEKTQTELNLVRDAVASFPVHIVEEDPDAFPVYDQVLAESRLLGQQEVALTFYEDPVQYVSAGLELANTRIRAHEIGYENLSSEFTIPLTQSLREKAFYQYLADHDIEIERNAENGANYLVQAIIWFSSILFFFILFLSSDILTKDTEHKTIIQAYPVDADQKILSKLIIQTVASIVVLISLFLVGYGSACLLFGSGTLAYPVTFFSESGYGAVSSTRFLGRFFIICTIFIIHTTLLSAVLNILFKNKYLTIFIGGSLYLVSFLFSSAISFFQYTPLNYLDPAGVLIGRSAERFSQNSIVFSQALVVLSVWSLIYTFFLSVHFARKHNSNRVKTAEGG